MAALASARRVFLRVFACCAANTRVCFRVPSCAGDICVHAPQPTSAIVTCMHACVRNMTKATPCWSPRDSGLLGSAIAGRASAPSDKTRICWYKHLWLSPACPTAPHASRLSPACPTAPHACTHTTDRLTAAPQNPPGLSGARCSNTSGANASAMLRHASHAYALTVTHTGCVLSFGNRLLKAGLKSPPPHTHTHSRRAAAPQPTCASCCVAHA
jgi:hypothetical protein